jgi:hypothetical protein
MSVLKYVFWCTAEKSTLLDGDVCRKIRELPSKRTKLVKIRCKVLPFSSIGSNAQRRNPYTKPVINIATIVNESVVIFWDDKHLVNAKPVLAVFNMDMEDG